MRIWNDDVKMHSSISIMESHWACREIVSMGHGIVPDLLRGLNYDIFHLCNIALHKILGFYPIKSENAGIVDKMRDDWHEWADGNQDFWDWRIASYRHTKGDENE